MNHGTYAGHQQHLRARTVPCEACLDAKRRYMLAYRTARPEYRAKEAANEMARQKAKAA